MSNDRKKPDELHEHRFDMKDKKKYIKNDLRKPFFGILWRIVSGKTSCSD